MTMSVSAPLPLTIRPSFARRVGHFALGVGAGGDRIDRIEQQLRAAAGDRLDRLEGRIDRAAADSRAFCSTPPTVSVTLLPASRRFPSTCE
jgi:hypothetical protein